MKTEARNFSGTYPLAGEKIGPAWLACWDRLSDQCWVAGPDVVHEVAELTGLNRLTITGLLSGARRAGQLEVSYRLLNSRKSAFYRVIS